MVRVARRDGGKKKRRQHPLLPRRPARPSNPYGAFLKDFWPSKNEQADRTRNSLKEASTQWKALPAADKERYASTIQADRNRYEQQITLWKRQRQFLKRPGTVYALFVKDMWARERNNRPTIATIGRMASAEWRNLGAEQKQGYTERWQRAQRNYRVSLMDFRAGLNVNLDRPLDTPTEYVSLLDAQRNAQQQADDADFDDEDEMDEIDQQWDDEDDDFLEEDDF